MEMAPLPPGYRFQPTDAELILYYLKRKILGKKLRPNPVTEIDIYQFAPWDLPGKSSMPTGDLQWYFFCTCGRKYPTGSRTNRSNQAGHWKATGKDRKVVCNSRTVGMKRTLVFHAGKGRKEKRTDWVMHEYRLVESEVPNAGVRLDDFVLCKVYQKSGPGPRIGEQYGAPLEEEEEEMNDANGEAYCLSHSSAPGPSHGGVLNFAGQSVSDGGRVSLSLLSANNGKSSSSGVRPDRASHPDVNWDRIHIQQLADILGFLSTNPVGQDGPPSDSTAYHDTEALFDDSEAIFDIADQVVPSSLVSLCKQCDSCGVRLVDPFLEPVAGEVYLELNDLLLCHAGHVPHGSSHEGPQHWIRQRPFVHSSSAASGTVSAAVSG
ncbi:hypothetical protein CFC21_081360 [Triticum aestivum]|uniref:NAC domain-containing protein n=2 Tax=Triticum aestivum TaxID=4565 RepID=A0A9R1L3V5_WHEAT|nr:NAC domain-containing protein 82-like [Triticum aestivum]KAF7076747.1 hypothetical protein CFC21_081360 [Triticum aestivum]